MIIEYLTELLERIGSTTKRVEKEDMIYEALLGEHGHTVHLYMWLTYNPYVRFGFFDVKLGNMCTIDTNFTNVLELLLTEYKQSTKGYRRILEQARALNGQAYWDLIQKMLKGDLDCGIGTATINKCISKTGSSEKIPDFKVAKAEEVKHLEKMTVPAYGNEKYDGARSFIVATMDSVDGRTCRMTLEMLSSSGRNVEQVEAFLSLVSTQIENTSLFDEIDAVGGAVIDGEMIAVEEDGTVIKRQTSNGWFNKMTNGNATPEQVNKMRFVAFDLLLTPSYGDVEKDTTPLSERKHRLTVFEEGIQDNLVSAAPYSVIDTIDDAHMFADEIIKRGGEGAIIKNIDSVYKLKRSKDWVKIKATYDVDVEVVGWSEHSKDKTMIGALEIATSDRLITGEVGTGKWMTHERRRELKEKADSGYLEGMILHTKIMEVTTDRKGEKRFYIPRVEEQRMDKFEADSHDKVMDMFK